MTYMSKALTSRPPRGHMQGIEEFNIYKLCIDFITIFVLKVSFTVILMVALI